MIEPCSFHIQTGEGAQEGRVAHRGACDEREGGGGRSQSRCMVPAHGRALVVVAQPVSSREMRQSMPCRASCRTVRCVAVVARAPYAIEVMLWRCASPADAERTLQLAGALPDVRRAQTRLAASSRRSLLREPCAAASGRASVRAMVRACCQPQRPVTPAGDCAQADAGLSCFGGLAGAAAPTRGAAV